MRVFWAGFLLTGLVLLGLASFEDGRRFRDVPMSADSQTSGETQTSAETDTVSGSEDGTPMPQPRR